MCYRLLEEYFGDEALYRQLIAVYAIGWPCTEEMTAQYPQIAPATGEDDLGVVVSFDCEAPEVTQTLITPAGVHALTINPLNWKTDGTPADKSENLGACFTKHSGEIKREEAGLCGCYIDDRRGVVKVTDVDPADFRPSCRDCGRARITSMTISSSSGICRRTWQIVRRASCKPARWTKWRRRRRLPSGTRMPRS